MDRHQRAIGEFLRRVTALDPVCSVYAKGSVGAGTYTETSDVDIDVITWCYEDLLDRLEWEPGKRFDTGSLDVRFQQGVFEEIQFDVLCLSPRNFHELVMTKPLYLWPARRIYYDPSGVAAWGSDCVRRFFAANPDLDDAYRKFKDEHARWKKDHAYEREHETIEGFVRSFDLSTATIDYPSFVETQLAAAETRGLG